MKNVFKFLILGMMTVAFYAVATPSIFAQATVEECEAVYQKFLANRKGPELDKYKTAIASGKEYLEKCGTLDGQEKVKEYVAAQLPKVVEIVRIKELETRFNDGVPNKKWDDAIASGKDLIASNRPYAFDVVLTIASIGYDNAVASPPVDKYNGDAITYAKMALQQIEGGKTSEDWGFFQYSYKTKECPDGKLNTTGWMNYTIGYIMYVRQKQNKEAVPYLYKATQVGCETKTFSEAYRLIGAWYLDEAIKLNNKRLELIKAAGDQDTDETKTILALQKGYADRAIDAYARAFKIASANKIATQTYKDSLYKKMQDLYKFRYDDKLDGIDQYIAGVMSKPFPDPTTAITPVVEETATTTPTTSSIPTNTATDATSTDTRPRTATTTATTAKPATTAVKPATTAVKPATTAATTTTKKAPAKKPIKKKGTR